MESLVQIASSTACAVVIPNAIGVMVAVHAKVVGKGSNAMFHAAKRRTALAASTAAASGTLLTDAIR